MRYRQASDRRKALAGLLLLSMIPVGAHAQKGDDAPDVVQFDDAPDLEHFRAAFPAGPERQFIDAVLLGDRPGVLHAAASLHDGVNTIGAYGHTALEIAVWRGDRQMVAALLAAGAKPNGTVDRAPIGLAFLPGRATARAIDLARMLVQAGADPNALSYGRTAMQDVAEEGNSVAIVALADFHADMNMTHADIPPAVLEAAGSGNWIAVETMLHHGGSIWVIDSFGFTLGIFAQNDQGERLNALLSSQEAAARDRVIDFLKAHGFPWPPPSLNEALADVKSGHWPPRRP